MAMKKKFAGILLVLTLIASLLPFHVLAEPLAEDPQAVSETTIAETKPRETSGAEDPAADAQPVPDTETGAEETQTASDPDLHPAAETATATEGIQAAASAEPAAADAKTYDRTILMYVCGSDLESAAGLASENLKQVLSSNFSKDNRVKYIVMTGGTEQWYLESNYLSDPAKSAAEQPKEISAEYNQIWEAVGSDAVLENGEKDPNAGKLVLLDGDGILGDGEYALPAQVDIIEPEDWDEKPVIPPHEWMSDPAVLRAFINYGVKQFPAEKYDLILWDHGAGPTNNSFAKDEHDPYGKLMSFPGLTDALRHNDLIDPDGNGTPDQKYDILNFDACLMSSVELLLAYSDITDCFIASPESIPGDGEVYNGWLNTLGENPKMDAYELGKKTVDDFYTFYENGYDNGTKEEATLAVFDPEKLLEGGFVSALSQINDIFSKEIEDGKIYDELLAVRNSIRYGDKGYFDFGNFISQLPVSQYEREGEEETNAYAEAAKTLCRLMNDPKAMYAKGTSGIKTGDFVYMNENGELKYSDRELMPVGTSGIYSFFFDPKAYTDVEYSYSKAMWDAFKQIPDGAVKQVLDSYVQNQLKLALEMGVARLVRKALDEKKEDGTPLFTKDTLDYESLRAHWKQPTVYDFDDEEEYESYWWDADWYLDILDLANLYWNRIQNIPRDNEDDPLIAELDEKVEGLLKDIVNDQFIPDAVLADQIDLYTVTHENGTGYQIRFHDTKKRVIAGVSAKIYAEIPAAEEYMEAAGIRSLAMKEGADILLGEERGEENIDMDLDASTEESFIEDYIKWLNNDTATWDLGAMEDKCYALKDEKGNIYACHAEPDGSKMLTMGGYLVEEVDEDGEKETVYWPVGLYFTDGVLTDLMLKGDDGSWRPVLLENLKTEIEIVPCSSVRVFSLKYYVPLSSWERKFTISKDTRLEMIYTDIDNIPDIQDKDGDGQKITRDIVVNDVFGHSIDLSKSEPAGNLVDIKLAEVEPAYYNGSVLTPKVIYNGQVLKEGVDYKLSKMTDDVVFQEVGDYTVSLDGIGNFTGVKLATFTILPGKEETPDITPDTPDVTPDHKPTPADPSKTPDTSDPNHMSIWILLMAVGAAFALGAGVFFGIRKD